MLGDAGGHGRAHAPEPGEADLRMVTARLPVGRGPTARHAGSRRCPAAVFRWDWLSRTVLSAPPAVQYLRPATSSSSAGNLVMTSQPSAVTTSSSSIRAADQPSLAGQ